MELKNIENPLCFIKVNTTGTNPKEDRIIDLSFIKFEPNKEEPVKVSRRYNPGIPIPNEASQINGISDSDLEDKPFFEEKASGIYEFIKDCDFVGFNIKDFDLPFLREELGRAGFSLIFYNKKIIDLLVLYRRLNPRNFLAAAKQYADKEYNKEDSISSNDYLETSYQIFKGILNNHKDQQVDSNLKVENDINQLHKISNKNPSALDLSEKIVLNEEGKPIFNFGKHSGELVSKVCVEEDPDYFNWLTTIAKDMPLDTIHIIKGIVKKAKQAKENAV